MKLLAAFYYEVCSINALYLNTCKREDLISIRQLASHVLIDFKQLTLPAQSAAMLRKQLVRKQEELQQAIAAGMVQEKGMGKKKQRQKDQQRQTNLGLYEVCDSTVNQSENHIFSCTASVWELQVAKQEYSLNLCLESIPEDMLMPMQDGGAFRNGILDARRLPGEVKKKKWKSRGQAKL